MRALCLVLALAGCAAVPPKTDLPLRNPTAPVASQADAALGRLSGDWRVVQGAGVYPGTRVRFDAGQAVIGGRAMPVTDEGQGRLMLGGAPVWVYWIDADNRTAALGDPDGRRVWIMDRTGTPGERLRAAREILAWYGYDLERLEQG
ncbi:lipocalin family protein [Mameliella alba]|uniref:lipocalin family protein n=1 Tax=Mameliella alba TaxID=561184 RepID=UPI001C971175|nr:lipocalin family protein [Mameliella alba]MBY6119729.1 lipocalin family protein [Mameliella alba]